MRGSATDPVQHIVLVAATDPALRDLLLRTLSRYVGSSRLVIANPVVTKLLPAGSGEKISQNTFAATADAGELELVWRCGQHAYGYRKRDLANTTHDRTIVLGIDASHAGAALAALPTARIVHLCTQTDRARATSRRHKPHAQVVHDASDIAGTIRALSRAVSEPARSPREHACRVEPHTAARDRKPAPRRSRRAATPQAPARLTA